MTVSPQVGIWLSVVLAIVSVLAGAGSEFTDLGLSPGTVKAIIAAINLLMGAGNAVNAVLHAIPATMPPNKAVAAEFPLGPSAKK